MTSLTKELSMKIKPYTFVQLTDGNYFFIESVVKRRVEIGTTNDKIIRGYRLKKSVVTTDKSEKSKNKLNIKTANYQEIVDFFYEHSMSCEDNYWAYVVEIEKLIKTKEIEFSIPDVDVI